MGLQNIYVNKEPGDTERIEIVKISRAIVRSRKIIPWKTLCFAEALAAKKILGFRKIESTLYLGLDKQAGDMKAHAWLKCGSVWVTGRRGAVNFTVISTFT